jgi:cysteine desulfurase
MDHAATTPIRREVTRAVDDAALPGSFNPSSLHAEGRRARFILDDARDRVAAAIGARRTEIVFTSGGTEANNLALLGVIAASPRPAHVVASAIEHHAVLAALEGLQAGGVEVTLLPVDGEGRVDPAVFERALRPATVLASFMYANNEVGTIEPIARLAAIARRHGVVFHTDAVAAPLWLSLDVQALGVDLLSLAAHKFYGPKGVGVLYVRDGVPLAPQIVGGGQESGRRSGTPNVPGIVGLALALELAEADRPGAAQRVGALRDHLESETRRRVPGAAVNGGGAARLPGFSNLSFEGVEASELLVALDLAGIAVSGGSACTSGTLGPSHVLRAMGKGQNATGVRFTLGAATTLEEIEVAIVALVAAVAQLRARGDSPLLSRGKGRLETNRARLEAEA